MQFLVELYSADPQYVLKSYISLRAYGSKKRQNNPNEAGPSKEGAS
tara:strand:- start:40 stop:177 length:138 start_codon:yes stop_codon:yes gene_type:complete